MPADDLDYGAAHEAEREVLSEIMGHAFATTPAGMVGWLERLGYDQLRVLRGPDGVRACLGLVPMGQIFGGRSLPIVGIVGVAVRSDWMRRGMATALMGRALHEIRAGGVAASSLYASTASLYRRVGYECAGSRHLAELLPLLAPSFREPTPPLRARQATPDDLPAVQALYRSVAGHHEGFLDRGPYVWARLCDERFGVRAHGLLFDDDDGLAGYLYYRKHPGADRHRVEVTDACARSPRAWRRIWIALGDLGTMVDCIELPTAPHDPLYLHHPDPRFAVRLQENWLMRVTDVVAMLEGRGYAPGVAGRVELRLEDPVLPEQAGAWQLEVEGGRGRLVRGGAGRLQLDARGLAAWCSGFVSPHALVQLGLGQGPPPVLELAGAIMAGPQPWMREMF
ncbi:GNAT family N-acetyltransferase [Paraliomyxa miuraensis]|uniref:GNAT family N-acetyltransferase n=1 Tax=Paraliomyxa miuraensis TaxID=376150 RepID=UPI00224FA05C|nr:GNAT family N-acetyltransferase [Paraliomyxa miuraensis]MCX4245169.1 GNAT family N-acetyltransferase [Paraliomyxa miuraensis]